MPITLLKRRALLLAVPLVAAGCATVGPPAIRLSRAEIGRRAFVDRREADVRQWLKGLEGLALEGPAVGVQLNAQRLQFTWTARLADRAAPLPLTLELSLSGQPVLNAGGNGIDLADARIEDVRLTALPFVGFDTRAFNQKGDTLGTVPLLAFRPDELTRGGLVYQASGLELGAFGLRVPLVPK